MIAILRQNARRWALPIHRQFRGQKAALFLDLVAADRGGRLLDIGGGTGIDGEFRQVYEQFASVTILNLEPQGFNKHWTQNARMVLADGCQLPFSSRSFDWILSNAVLEHVGGCVRQKTFAEEVRRVAGTGYFVTTPDRYFPIEPHTLCPFYQFLPAAVQTKVAPYTLGYLKHHEEINLLSAAHFQRLFPEAKIKRVGFPVWGNSLVALWRV